MVPMKLGNRHRIEDLGREVYDLLICGGGINGAGIAREAALRGFKVLLLEKADFASGSSSRSTKLAHGGLRYLETREFSLVRESLHERGILFKTLAPHLVKPMPFLLPFYQGDRWPSWYLKAGLWLYDALALGSEIGVHQSLSRTKTLELEAGLNAEGLKGSALYWDCQMNDARLVLENIQDAERLGAHCQNYMSLVSAHALRLGDVRARVRDELLGQEAEVRASLLINAAGPWVDELLGRLGRAAAPVVKPTKGVHLITKPLTKSHAMFLPARADKRIFFVIPWQFNGHAASLVGTTDTDFRGDMNHVRAEAEDSDYLLRELKRVFPQERFAPADLWASYAGLRPLNISQQAGASNSSISRESAVLETEAVITVTGGKFTTYRAMGQRVVDRALALVNRLGGDAAARPSRTSQSASQVLPGAPKNDRDRDFLANPKSIAAQYSLEETTVVYLISLYGMSVQTLLDLTLEEPQWKQGLAPGSPAILAQVVFAVRYEKVQRLVDFYLRRTFLGLELAPDHKGVDKVAATMGNELKWSRMTEVEELENLKRVVAGEYR
jgi:glycerol-3-phosphate dehydrogenase